MRRVATSVIVVGLGIGGFPLPEGGAAGGLAVVQMADGTKVPLRAWSLSYEFQPLGASKPARRSSMELWVGKRSFPLPGRTVEIRYREVQRGREIEGRFEVITLPLVEELAVVEPDGKRRSLKPEPPHRDRLRNASEGVDALPRSLDIQGETLMGTRREFCLLGYSALVECAPPPGDRVVRIEFQK